ncbi:MAG: hypothetical protein IPP97_05595 [Candidatus Obscuribacter sp.]|nr:hypothetical protein [Candidatus Obscuribacter sp.]MBP6594407.1 hypothetical protein [Candidatus Obscuribacter sp.]MBP7576345.1 hypothetical protein [Candidatus Obscuribacter sp.]
MRIKTTMLLAAAVLLAICPYAQAADEAEPKFMDKMTIRVIEPKSAKDSFEAEAKTVYLSGSKYVRTEEAIDPKMNIQLLIVVNEPDAWSIDLISKSGKHMIDPGPVFEMQSPVFDLDPEVYKEIDKLEFGREVEFFAKNGVQKTSTTLDGKTVNKYEHLADGKLHVTLWTSLDKDIPLQISLREGKKVQTIRYEDYQENIAFEPELFKVPAGITISEPSH